MRWLLLTIVGLTVGLVGLLPASSLAAGLNHNETLVRDNAMIR